ncbi:MAG: hypothetical protein IJ779_06550 [Ruminococcus sp.]|nr:hypothetical protein [Ruminococcus sp.]
MITIRNSTFLYFANNVCVDLVELEVDSVSELPSADFMAGHKLSQGTLAHDISTGAFYALDSTGTWYAQDGSGAVEVNGNAESV